MKSKIALFALGVIVLAVILSSHPVRSYLSADKIPAGTKLNLQVWPELYDSISKDSGQMGVTIR